MHVQIAPAPRTARMTATLRITVLAGGPSAEREVSLQSGNAIAAALRRRGHDVFTADISPDDLSGLDRECDLVFPALHGTFGEDGQLQKLLEERKIPFVGSGSRASEIAIDKVATKNVARRCGLRIAGHAVLEAPDLARWAALEVPIPCVVKPINQGSSVLTTIVRQAADFERAARAVIEQYGRVLAEQFIPGEEITVGIINGDPLPPILIRPKRTFYDYDAKYVADDTEYLFDAKPATMLRRAQEQTTRIFNALGCRHLARMDFICDQSNELWFLEANTLPGFTSHSLVPKAAAHIGICFDELVDRLAQNAWSER
jgi:D-alanine-D-alanine ligase